MQELTSATVKTERYPIKVVQFGEGNFLRAFVDWMINHLNKTAAFDAGVAVVQPIEHGMVEALQKQDGLYHHLIRGISKGKVINEIQLISCIQKLINPFKDLHSYFDLAKIDTLSLIVSNTTEAGIAFDENDKPAADELANTFPGKLTQLLLKRFKYFDGNLSKGLGIIPCELIDRNGDQLKNAILKYASLWNLPTEFKDWINNANYFGNTLVDRIVPGFPREEINEIQKRIGYNDNLVVASEAFHLWIIEGSAELQKLFPAHKHGLNVKYVLDQTPYRIQKVRILNGAHTSMVAVALLAGLKAVRETIEDKKLGLFFKEIIFKEIIPTIDLPKSELEVFANDIIERFENPFINHELASISLNSISKFKVRVLPTIEDYLILNNEAPLRLCIAFAGLIKLYMLGAKGEVIDLKDKEENILFFKSLSDEDDENIVKKVLANLSFWDKDLTENKLLLSSVAESFKAINQKSIIQLVASTLP